RPDRVPRASVLLMQIPPERSQKVGELLWVPAVLMTPRDRCARRSVILRVVLVLSESSPPLLARISVASSWPFGDDLGHVASHIGVPPLRHRSPPLKNRVEVIRSILAARAGQGSAFPVRAHSQPAGVIGTLMFNRSGALST